MGSGLVTICVNMDNVADSAVKPKFVRMGPSLVTFCVDVDSVADSAVTSTVVRVGPSLVTLALLRHVLKRLLKKDLSLC